MLYSFDQHQLKNSAVLSAGEPTDEQLMERIQQGDETALATLSRRHSALIRTIVSRMINNDHDVDELVQDCLIEVWRRAENYRVDRGQVLGWMVTLARRRTIDRIRRKMSYHRAQERLREETSTHREDTHTGADEEASLNDRAEAISRLIAKLPEPQQEAVRLTYFQGMTQRQIAAHTGIPLGTIKTRIELAQRKLRAAVLAFGELHEDAQPAQA
jgi:RNA polymerase sigma-70 factor (ECF subfamily)